MRTSSILRVIAILAYLPIPAFAAELIDPTTVNTVASFFRMPPGTVAHLPQAETKEDAKAAWVFSILGENGAYQIPAKRECWFIINHRDTSRDQGTSTFAAVQMALFGDTGFKEPILVYRNAGWARPDDDISVLDEITEQSKGSMADFFDLHRQDDVKLLDQFLGVLWHARATSDSKHSWEKRYYWDHDVEKFDSSDFRDSFIPPISESKNMRHQSYLIKFSTTHRVDSERPVLFKFNCQNNDHAWLRIFSPDYQEFDRIYYLSTIQ